MLSFFFLLKSKRKGKDEEESRKVERHAGEVLPIFEPQNFCGATHDFVVPNGTQTR
jgi:hypothetical protein